MTDTILIRCDASAPLGWGHARRCLVLADELVARGCAAVLLTTTGDAAGLFTRAGHEVILDASADLRLLAIVKQLQARVIIMDIRTPLPGAARLRHPHLLTVVIDDPGPCRLHADLAFYPPTPLVETLDWREFDGERFSGWEWVLLGPDFRNPAPPPAPHETPRLVISCGGSDPAGLTLVWLDALARLKCGFELTVIVGPGFADPDEVRRRASRLRQPWTIRIDPPDLPDLIQRADLGLISFGTTAYELAALHVPMVCLCLSEEHAAGTLPFAAEGIGRCLGTIPGLDPTHIAGELERILRAGADRTALLAHLAPGAVTHRFPPQLDGRGAERIAEMIMKAHPACREARP